MTDSGSAERPTKNQRREAAREKARALREQQRKRERRNRFLLQGGIGVAILAVLAIVAIVIVSSVKPPQAGPANMADGGITIGKDLKAVRTAPQPADATPAPISTASPSGDAVHIVTYIDYLCPYCGQFEKTNAVQIGELAKSGAATVEIHPVNQLANQSQGTKYSLRSANAAACVANYQPDQFYAFHRKLFENQPDESSSGLTDKQIKALVKKAGITSTSSIDECIDKGKYEQYIQRQTTYAQENPALQGPQGFGTPTVLVNGTVYTGPLNDATAFRTFVLSASSQGYKPTASPTPAPPTPTPSAKK